MPQTASPHPLPPPAAISTKPERWLKMILGAAAGLATLLYFLLGYHRKPRYMQNFEADEFTWELPYIKPTSIAAGLAVYAQGTGPPVLLFPYPHGHTSSPMAHSPIAAQLVAAGHAVITFDAPGAYQSTRTPAHDMDEMLRAADETLARLHITDPVDTVGHSMGGLVALAFAIERPERTRRLVLANSISGFPAAARCGLPGSAFTPFQADYWRVIIWGMRVNNGRASLATHKRLYNLMSRVSFYNQALFKPIPIKPDDKNKGVPIRMNWSRNMFRRLSYADRLEAVAAPTLILAGRYDPQASLDCAHQLHTGIPNSRLVIFDQSGHAPFIEEAALFAETVGAFLHDSHA